MPFQIIRNDITKVTADAIVNTANPKPVIGGGTDWAIHNAAGPELLKARQKIGDIGVGQSMATPAFGLSARYVLHTVSPIWVNGKYHEEEHLREAYDSALNLAKKLGCKSVAFPLLSTGTYGYPHDQALAVAIRAFTDFLLDHKMQIYLVLFSAAAVGVAGSIFDDLKSYIDDNYVSEKNEEEYFTDEYPTLNAASILPDRAESHHRRRMERERRGRMSYAGSAPQAPLAASQPDAHDSLADINVPRSASSFSVRF